MAKFMFEVDYTAEGTKGLIKDGGSRRRAVVEKALKDVGGKIEAFYFTFGIRDAVVIVDLPDTVTAIAISLAVSATGALRFRTTPLIEPEEVDRASKKSVAYKAPGAK
jgi:uncharacterized protein with GYD domain